MLHGVAKKKKQESKQEKKKARKKKLGMSSIGEKPKLKKKINEEGTRT